jgi:hypothetical protein
MLRTSGLEMNCPYLVLNRCDRFAGVLVVVLGEFFGPESLDYWVLDLIEDMLAVVFVRQRFY